MITDSEREEIIKEVIARIEPKCTAERVRALQPTFHKWFRDGNDPPYDAKMREIMSGYEAYALWDLIRRATCNLCGVKYVRQITDAEKANRIADTICQTIYDLGKAERQADTPQTDCAWR